MKNIKPNTIITEPTWVKKAFLAYCIQDFLINGSFALDALKKEIVEMMDAMNESNTKNCPI